MFNPSKLDSLVTYLVPTFLPAHGEATKTENISAPRVREPRGIYLRAAKERGPAQRDAFVRALFWCHRGLEGSRPERCVRSRPRSRRSELDAYLTRENKYHTVDVPSCVCVLP